MEDYEEPFEAGEVELGVIKDGQATLNTGDT